MAQQISQRISSLFQMFRIEERQRNVKRKHLFYIAARWLDIARRHSY